MRSGINSEVLAALEAKGITTCILGCLEFKSETVNVWTGAHQQRFEGSTDSLLNNRTFEPLVHGVVLNIGDNSFSMNGSDQLEISLAIPADPSVAITAASVYPDEYQGRTATLWRAIMIAPAIPGKPPIWAVRRIRSGAMDTVRITRDGTKNEFTLAIEGHASMTSGATGSTYMDQKRFDASDTSQDYVAACANGDPAPGKSRSTGWERLTEQFEQMRQNPMF